MGVTSKERGGGCGRVGKYDGKLSLATCDHTKNLTLDPCRHDHRGFQRPTISLSQNGRVFSMCECTTSRLVPHAYVQYFACRVTRLRLHAMTRQKRHIWLQLGGFELRVQGNFATTLRNSSYDMDLLVPSHLIIKDLLSDSSGYSDWTQPYSCAVGAEVSAQTNAAYIITYSELTSDTI